MNKLARNVLALYAHDPDGDSIDLQNVLRQSLTLIARFPLLIAYSYVAMLHYLDNKSLFVHAPLPEYSIAENILRMIRPSGEFTELEARILDLIMVLHAEHGGGNNSTFAVRAVTSTGTDTYSAIAAGIGSPGVHNTAERTHFPDDGVSERDGEGLRIRSRNPRCSDFTFG